jgi:hypothetical protein
MHLKPKWFIISFGGGILITASLALFPNAVLVSLPPSLNVIADVVFWPVALCEHLVGPGPIIGPPTRHLHEGTPLNFLAAAVGMGLSWMFYSSLVFLVIGYRCRRNA